MVLRAGSADATIDGGRILRIQSFMAKSQYFIGVDIGGTFTDVVLAESISHRLFTAKTLTTPDSPGQAVITAMQDALGQAQATPADVQRVVHATTLATNLISGAQRLTGSPSSPPRDSATCS